MYLTDFMTLARAFSNLGDAMMTQAEYFAADGRDEDQLNSNALRYIKDWVQDVRREALSSDDEELAQDCWEMLEQIDEYLG